ncbi:MAG: AAA family ATPase [Kangiellaceae bacterium]|nr:AAA family ATPase [Kangiellaceae bacterium]
MTRKASIIAVTSGKGGVGKTHISANLGILLAKQSRRTCIIDADHGLANINLILGIPASRQPVDLFDREFDLTTAMIHSDLGIDILPSASGISQQLTNHEGYHQNLEPNRDQISGLLERLRPMYDVIIIDTAAGISDTVKHYLELADHVLLTINSEPTSLTDAFGLIRKMKSVQPFYNVIINRVSNAAAATSVYKRFSSAVRKYIGAQVGAIGYISEDSFVSAAVLSQTAVVNYSPNCQATQCLKRISRTLSRKIAEDVASNKVSNMGIFAKIDQNKNVSHLASSSEKEEQQVEQIIDAIPDSPGFIKAKDRVDPFHAWLSQLDNYFDKKTSTEKTLKYRKRKLVKALEQLCDGDKDFLADLETLVVNSSVKNSGNILDQTGLANRLANTRFVEEPVMEPANGRHSMLSSQGLEPSVARPFSIISKLK